MTKRVFLCEKCGNMVEMVREGGESWSAVASPWLKFQRTPRRLPLRNTSPWWKRPLRGSKSPWGALCTP